MYFVEVSQAAAYFGIVVDTGSAYVHYHFRAIAAQAGVYVLDKVVYAFVLQAHSVEHARRSFGHSGVGVALARGKSGTLDYESAKAVKVYKVGEFLAVTKGARGGEHRILQLQRAQFY